MHKSTELSLTRLRKTKTIRAMQNLWHITAVYKFTPINEQELADHQEAMHSEGERLGIIGLMLIAAEGINATVAGTQEGLEAFKKFLTERYGELVFKDSTSTEEPFKRWLVKIRDEIVHIGDKEMHPDSPYNNHLTPDEWNAMMENEDVIIIDTRNTYETEIGMFKGAIDPKIGKFTDFPTYVKESNIPKDKKVLMYCTGGIRCEKASLEMQRQGYKHVYQLKGGILQYLKEHPHEKFEGECFVFDHRAAVNQTLDPSEKYKLCPHCGDPGDISLRCARCNTKSIICERCNAHEHKQTCSKDCTYHLERGHTQRKVYA